MANKARRLITIEADIDEKLAGFNASQLIAELLQNHFHYLQSNDIEVLTKKRTELERKAKDIYRQIDDINDKIKQMEEQSDKIQKQKNTEEEFNNLYNQIKKYYFDKIKAKEMTMDEYLEQIKPQLLACKTVEQLNETFK